MPFTPHTHDEIQAMLGACGVDSIDALFDEVPENLRSSTLEEIPEALTEAEITRLMHERAYADGMPICFAGAGAYDHHVPAAVWELASRGEFYTAYTPYQAEASQGTLQVLYEYQSMMAKLMAMEVSNASLYDGASALGEAILMAVRANRKSKSKRILVPRSLSPIWRRVAKAVVGNQGIELVEVDFNHETGLTLLELLEPFVGEDIAALVVPQPNFFGGLEGVDGLTDWAHTQGALVVGVVNPLLTSVLKPPGKWGALGADIACGEGQPLGAPLASGGPYFGFLCATQKLVRQMPGRIVGRTVDLQGKPGFALTLQAREQHIRRSKATSNICTNQGLMVTAATIHMALMGSAGLSAVAKASYARTAQLVDRLTAIDGVERVFTGSSFHEVALRIEVPINELIGELAAVNMVAGYDLGQDYPELNNCLLVCATEKRTDEEIAAYGDHLERILSSQVVQQGGAESC